MDQYLRYLLHTIDVNVYFAGIYEVMGWLWDTSHQFPAHLRTTCSCASHFLFDLIMKENKGIGVIINWAASPSLYPIKDIYVYVCKGGVNAGLNRLKHK